MPYRARQVSRPLIELSWIQLGSSGGFQESAVVWNIVRQKIFGGFGSQKKVEAKQRWVHADKSLDLAWGQNRAVTERLVGEWFDGQEGGGQRDRESWERRGRRKRARRPIWLLVIMIWWGGLVRVAGGGSPFNPMSNKPGPQVSTLLGAWETFLGTRITLLGHQKLC